MTMVHSERITDLKGKKIPQKSYCPIYENARQNKPGIGLYNQKKRILGLFMAFCLVFLYRKWIGTRMNVITKIWTCNWPGELPNNLNFLFFGNEEIWGKAQKRGHRYILCFKLILRWKLAIVLEIWQNLATESFMESPSLLDFINLSHILIYWL